jgi:hypothetical protein
MERYIGLDVSLKSTAICIVDAKGRIVREGAVTTDPETIATFIGLHAPEPVRIGLESGATSTWLWTELKQLGLPAGRSRVRPGRLIVSTSQFRSASAVSVAFIIVSMTICVKCPMRVLATMYLFARCCDGGAWPHEQNLATGRPASLACAAQWGAA